jgi:hypothetical protein
MPLVGNKHFAYTPEGMKKALAHAEKTGQKVKVDKKGIGGMVKKYSKGGDVKDLHTISKELKNASKMHASQAKRVKKHADSMQDGGMLKGPSHKKGGIPAVVKGSGQPIEMEGGEYIIKKDSAKKLGPDILNYINKTGNVPKMKKGGKVSSSSAGSNIKKNKDGYEMIEVIKVDTPDGPRYYKAKAKSRTEHMASEIASARAKAKAVSNPSDSLTTKQYKTNWDAKTGRKKNILRKATDKLGITKMSNGGGLYANIHAKRKRIASGSGEKMRKPGSKGAPTKANFLRSAQTAKMSDGGEIDKAMSNPYLKDYFEQTKKTKDALAANAVTPEEYEKLKSERYHKTASPFNPFNTGKRRWQDYNMRQMAARNYQKQAAKRAREKAEARTGVSDFQASAGLASRGGLRARADQKAAARFVDEYGNRTDFKHGGSVDSIFSLLKKMRK